MANTIGGVGPGAGAVQSGQAVGAGVGDTPTQTRTGRMADGRTVVWPKGAVSPGSLRNVTSVPQLIAKPLSERVIARGEDKGSGDAALRGGRSFPPARE